MIYQDSKEAAIYLRLKQQADKAYDLWQASMGDEESYEAFLDLEMEVADYAHENEDKIWLAS